MHFVSETIPSIIHKFLTHFESQKVQFNQFFRLKQQQRIHFQFARKKQNIILSILLLMKPYVKAEEFNTPIVIGYYPFQAKAHILRLLCEFLHLKYVDKFFNPDQWNKYKENEAKDWIIQDLPFCIDGNFVVTGRTAIISYLVEKAGQRQLLGNNLYDRMKITNLKVKQDLKNAILGLMCSNRSQISQDSKKVINETWKTKVQPIVLEYESECPEEGWYFGYITIMDFVVFETLNVINLIFSSQTCKFKKLMKLKMRFSEIAEIKAYENSTRAVMEESPIEYFKKFKQQKMKKSKNNTEMDVQ